MAEWQQIGGGVVNSDAVQGTINTASDVLTGLATVLRIISEALGIVDALLLDPPNVLEAIVGAAVNTIEQTILDILQNNVGLAVHTNLVWDPDWKYRRAPGDTPGATPDFINDDKLPWMGSGIDGWLLDVAFSANDPLDPFRPLTDGDTAVQGLIVLNGILDNGDLQQLKALYDLFTDFSAFKEILDTREKLENASEGFKSLLRLGPLATDPAGKGLLPLEELIYEFYGTSIATGTAGTNEAGSDLFVDLAGLFTSVGVGDVLRIGGVSTPYSVVEVVGSDTLRVDPPIVTSGTTPRTWDVTRGGIGQLLASLPPDLREFAPVPGAYPKWMSVPTASLIPGIAGIFEGLRKLLEQLRVGSGHGTALRALSNLLKEKANLLAQIVEEITQLLDTVESIITFFESAYIIVVSTDSGGMAGFINEAMAGTDKPDFGTKGVVAGMVAVATSDDPSNHFENFLSLLGLQLSTYTTDLTARANGLEETWGDLFP